MVIACLDEGLPSYMHLKKYQKHSTTLPLPVELHYCFKNIAHRNLSEVSFTELFSKVPLKLN